jgi:uncharacterized protein
MITSAPFMSCREEQDFAGLVIDSHKFAAGEECVSGRIELDRLTRLADVLVDTAGFLDCRLSGFRGEGELSGKLGLHLQVNGRLGLGCQRCLSKVDFECAIDSRLLLIPVGEAWPEDELETDSYDAIPAERELLVLALVEEEVLLSLPLVPRHPDCQVPAASGSSVPPVEKSVASPFAALAGLKKH